MDYYGGYLDVSSDIYHHGILGMKWGVRRYQNEDGSLTDAGRKRYGQGIKAYLAARKKKRRLEKARKKRMKTIAKKKAYEQEKKDAIDSADPIRISKFQKDLTNEELRQITDRVRLAETLRSQANAANKTGLDKAESAMNKVSRARDLVEKGIAAYNTAAKIHNSLVDEDKKWITIDGVSKKKDRSAIEKIIKTGDPEQIARLRGELTVDEVSQAYKSVNNWKNINKEASERAEARETESRKAETAREFKQTKQNEWEYQKREKERARSDSEAEQERMDRAFEEGKRYYEQNWSNRSNDKQTSPQAKLGEKKVNQYILEMKKDRRLWKDEFPDDDERRRRKKR